MKSWRIFNILRQDRFKEIADEEQSKRVVKYILKHYQKLDLDYVDVYGSKQTPLDDWIQASCEQIWRQLQQKRAEKIRKRKEKKEKRVHEEFVEYMASLSRGEKPKPMSKGLQDAFERSRQKLLQVEQLRQERRKQELQQAES